MGEKSGREQEHICCKVMKIKGLSGPIMFPSDSTHNQLNLTIYRDKRKKINSAEMCRQRLIYGWLDQGFTHLLIFKKYFEYHFHADDTTLCHIHTFQLNLAVFVWILCNGPNKILKYECIKKVFSKVHLCAHDLSYDFRMDTPVLKVLESAATRRGT